MPSLALPDRKQLPPVECLPQYAAVALFIARAHAVQPDFQVTPATAPAIAEICSQLDGLPLAIELAAARSKLLTPPALLARLSSRLKLLTGGARDRPARQQTIRATIEWSYHLLSSAEQRLFAHLAVFMGGWTLEAAEAVCQPVDVPAVGAGQALGLEVLDGVQSLLDKSLVRQEPAPQGEPRFGMLETIREYALEQLEASGDAEVLRRQHAAYYLHLAETGEARLRGPGQVEWLRRLALDHDNFRAALAWASMVGEADVGLQLAAALWQFWYLQGHLSEGRRWLAQALQQPGGAAPLARATALERAGFLAYTQDDLEQAVVLGEQALALYQELHDSRGVAYTRNHLALIARARGDWRRAMELHAASLPVLQQVGDCWGSAWTLRSLGLAVTNLGDYPRAARLLEQSLTICRACGDTNGTARALSALGTVVQAQGEYGRAVTLYAESVPLFRALGDRVGLAYALLSWGRTARMQGAYQHAHLLEEESLTLFRDLGDKHGVARTYLSLGDVALDQGDVARASTYFQDILGGCKELGTQVECAWARANLGRVAYVQGDAGRAMQCYQESLALFHALHDQASIQEVLLELGRVAHRQGDNAVALQLYRDSLALQGDRGSPAVIADGLEGMAGVIGATGRTIAAVQLFGAAEALRTAFGMPRRPVHQAAYAHALAAIQAQLDAQAFTAAWAEGQAMPLEQAIAYALEPDTSTD